MPRIELGPRSYDIVVTLGQPHHFGKFITDRTNHTRTVLVVDANVASHAQQLIRELEQAGLSVSCEFIAPGEATKSVAAITTIWSRLANKNTERQTSIIALGGGVVSDVAGFVAATYARGLPWFVVPTSLLAMVDSAIGGKVGINLPEGKNLVGAIHQPRGVWIDLASLESLPDREIRSGLAEVVKYGAAMDAAFFGWLESHAEAVVGRDMALMRYLVEKCCELKARIVSEDERELSGLRLVLNYGHTFAHAFETASGYTGSHGEAVAAGLVCASRLAESQGWIEPDITHRLVALLRRFGLPTAAPKGQARDWIAIMRRDKKATQGQVRFVLPRAIGRVELAAAVPEAAVAAVLSLLD